MPVSFILHTHGHQEAAKLALHASACFRKHPDPVTLLKVPVLLVEHGLLVLVPQLPTRHLTFDERPPLDADLLEANDIGVAERIEVGNQAVGEPRPNLALERVFLPSADVVRHNAKGTHVTLR